VLGLYIYNLHASLNDADSIPD